MHLSNKQKIYSYFFWNILKSRSNFEPFEKKDNPLRLRITQIMDRKRRD